MGSGSPSPPALSSPAGCAELYFLRYGHTDRWAHPDRQTTDKCNSHAHASGRVPHPWDALPRKSPSLVPPRLGGERWALPRGAGRRGWGGATLPAPQLRAEGTPAPQCPTENSLTGGQHVWLQGQALPASPPQHSVVPEHPRPAPMPSHPPRCGTSPPEQRGWGQHAVPPGSATLLSITVLAGGAARELPGTRHPPRLVLQDGGDTLRQRGWGTHAGHSTAHRIRPQQPAPAGGYRRPQAEPVPRPAPSSPSTICPS